MGKGARRAPICVGCGLLWPRTIRHSALCAEWSDAVSECDKCGGGIFD